MGVGVDGGEQIRAACRRLSTGELLRLALAGGSDTDEATHGLHLEALDERVGDLRAFLAEELARSGELLHSFPAGQVHHCFARGRWQGPWRGDLYLFSRGIGFIATGSELKARLVVGGLPVELAAHALAHAAPTAALPFRELQLPVATIATMYPDTAFFEAAHGAMVIQRLPVEVDFVARDGTMIRWRTSRESVEVTKAWCGGAGIGYAVGAQPGWLERIWEAFR